ncbi:Ferric iron ABC transporter, iron-binding protein [hydrothermal vent metagenome]|uniref:Ferric iron ABC transporter, iron-binding protein n=1 Tax=hydrothermal vent metagenome TaxID=652676 RepID=A0A3B0SZ56_9ZZZZ
MPRLKLIAFAAAVGLMAMAPGAQASGDVLTIYNATNPKLVTKIIDEFKAKTPGIDVDVINAGVGELLTRIRAEKGKPRGDIYFGASVEAYMSALNLFAPYKTKEHDKFNADVIGPDNKFYGFSMPLQAFIINTKLMPAGTEPKSWADLGDPRFKGKIVMANPSLSGSAYAQLAQMLQIHGWDLIKKVIDNTTFVTSSKLVYQNVGKGEVAIGITGDYNVIKMRDKGFPVTAIYPSEGTGLRFDANGLIAGGPNPDAAKKFLDFANTAEAHEIMVSLRNRRSVRTDVSAPKGQIPTADVPTFNYDTNMAASQRKANLTKFDELFSAKN